MARRRIDPKARSAKAAAARVRGRTMGPLAERKRAELMRAVRIAKVRGKDTAVQPIFGGGTGKRTKVTITRPGRPGGTTTTVASNSIRSASPGTSYRRTHAQQKETRRRIQRSPGAKHFNLKPAQGKRTAVRARRQGILASRGGSTGKRLLSRRVVGGKGLVASLAARGARNPQALAAWIGRRKYGAAGMAAKAAAGRRHRR